MDGWEYGVGKGARIGERDVGESWGGRGNRDEGRVGMRERKAEGRERGDERNEGEGKNLREGAKRRGRWREGVVPLRKKEVREATGRAERRGWLRVPVLVL